MKDINICPLLDGEPLVVDYESRLDHLASRVGLLYSYYRKDEDLLWICEMLYHLTTALRHQIDLKDKEVEGLINLGFKYKDYLPDTIILPIGTYPETGFAHLARSESQAIIAHLRKCQAKGMEIDEKLYVIFDSLSQYFFGLAMSTLPFWDKHEFVSRTYR